MLFRSDLQIKKSSLILILSFLVLIFVLVSFCFSFSLKEKRIKDLESQIKNLEQELSLLKSLPLQGISGPEEFAPGEIGEPEEREKESALVLPPLIFNTTGEVKEIKENGIIASGSGSNFTDQKPRELTLLFTKDTLLAVDLRRCARMIYTLQMYV